MGPFDWLMDDPLMKAEWRFASMECGGQCVTLVGIIMMQQLCADNWVTASAQVSTELGIRLEMCVSVVSNCTCNGWISSV